MKTSRTSILMIHSDGGKVSFPLGPGIYSIGRDSACDVVVDSLYLAPRQARIHIGESHFQLEDLSDSPRAMTAAGQSIEIPGVVHFGEFTVEVIFGEAVLRGDAWNPTPSQNDVLAKEESPGVIIGPYTLTQRLGEGGFGTVWRADQSFPVRREVAIKILKPGLDSREILGRFEQERQALARMSHPGIARVFDAGATPAGRPFFVMEWVAGVPVSEYVHRQRLETRDRLRLFIQVCQAAQHAHQKGVIHRDLKPSNILVCEVDGRPTPKIIDFGIAKATGGEKLGEFTVVTQREQVIGTPAYMSPEQARRNIGDIDTRSDIYSLGVVLYELLTGTTPFDGEELAKTGNEEMFKVIRERVPERPSTRIKSTSRKSPKNLDVAPPDAQRLLGGDLDWIVMKCLEKEPDRRYDSASALAEELEAYLDQRPILARPPSLGYQAWRFTQRNKVAVFSAVAILVAIVGGLAFSTVMLLREREARQTADAETEKSRQVAVFLKDTLGAVGPSVALGRDTSLMREILDRTTARIDTELSDRPKVSAELRQIIGNTYTEIREFKPALEQMEKALQLQRSLHKEAHPELAACLIAYADTLEMASQVKEAEPFAREGLAMWQKLTGNDSIETAGAKTMLAWILLKSGRAKEGEAMVKEAFPVWQRHPLNPLLEATAKTLATIYQHTGRNPEAAPIYAEELRVLRENYGVEHPVIVNCLDNYGMLLVNLKRDSEAEKILMEALTMGRKFFEDRSPHEDHVLGGLATLAARRGDLAAQLDYARRGREVGARVYPPGHRYWRESQSQYLRVMLSQIETYLGRAVKTSAERPGREDALSQAGQLLAELAAAKDIDRLKRPEQLWIDCLEAERDLARSVLFGSASKQAEDKLQKAYAQLSKHTDNSAAKPRVKQVAAFLTQVYEWKGDEQGAAAWRQLSAAGPAK